MEKKNSGKFPQERINIKSEVSKAFKQLPQGQTELIGRGMTTDSLELILIPFC